MMLLVDMRNMGLNLLHGAQRYLDEGVDESFQFTLLAIMDRLGLLVARSSQYKCPEVHAMHVLPIVYLLVRFLLI